VLREWRNVPFRVLLEARRSIIAPDDALPVDGGEFYLIPLRPFRKSRRAPGTGVIASSRHFTARARLNSESEMWPPKVECGLRETRVEYHDIFLEICPRKRVIFMNKYFFLQRLYISSQSYAATFVPFDRNRIY